MTEEQALGERIRTLRKQAGLSQEKLAEDIGADRKTIQYLELGITDSPDIRTIYKLAKRLGTTMEYFYPLDILKDLPSANVYLYELQEFLHSESDLELLNDIRKIVSKHRSKQKT